MVNGIELCIVYLQVPRISTQDCASQFDSLWVIVFLRSHGDRLVHKPESPVMSTVDGLNPKLPQKDLMALQV